MKIAFHFLLLVVWPYRMTFRHSTLDPILNIARATKEPNIPRLIDVLNIWRETKDHELRFVKVASTVVAAASLTTLSFPTIDTTYWLAPAFWYCSLLISIWAGITSAQQSALLETVPPLDEERDSHVELMQVLKSVLRQPIKLSPPSAITCSPSPSCDPKMERDEEKAQPENSSGHGDREGDKRKESCLIDWNMVYIWQVPIMLMCFAWASFIVGLTLHVCTPLIEGSEWGRDHRIAFVYAVVGGITFVNFLWCTFWQHHNTRGFVRGRSGFDLGDGGF